MIYGAPYWNDTGRYYVQTNNPTEETLRKAGQLTRFLESCGPSAAVNCMAALGHDTGIICPGRYQPQPEEVMMDFFNDPVNYPRFRLIRNDVAIRELPFNRVPQYYPFAAFEVFEVDAAYLEGGVLLAEESLCKGKAVQACLKEPGHYIALVAYDRDGQEFIYNDSWPGRFPDGKGFNRRMDKAEYIRNVLPFMIVYK